MILIVEDDRYSGHILAELLEIEGFEVLTADSADEALEILKKRNKEITVVISDIMMKTGEMMSEIETRGGFETGFILSAIIRNAFPRINIIGISGGTELSKMKESKLFDYVFMKPLINTDVLVDALKIIKSKKESKIELIDAINISPSFFGIGVDFKKIIKWLNEK